MWSRYWRLTCRVCLVSSQFLRVFVSVFFKLRNVGCVSHAANCHGRRLNIASSLWSRWFGSKVSAAEVPSGPVDTAQADPIIGGIGVLT